MQWQYSQSGIRESGNSPFSTYRGATIIVDDPTVISALSDGGYTATEYLNGTLADALARQVH